MPIRRISTRRRKNKNEEIGFSTLPDQVHRKFLKRGFEFTLLVAGESGLGKSTFVNSLFLTDLYSDREIRSPSVDDTLEKTVEIVSQTVELEEKGVRLRLTIVDTPGFGDSINTNNCWKPITNYIDEKLEKYYLHESGYGVDRKKFHDQRVHCCLYFIPPYVRGLRKIDIETMKNLHDRVNLVPVIAKADSLTKNEIERLKSQIIDDIERHNIKLYEFPESDSDDDDEFKRLDNEIKNSIPFAIIGSNIVMEYGNKRIRGRAYPWGIVDIESPENCDFTKLRTFLCCSHMQDLKDVTNDLHYENFRSKYIQTVKKSISSSLYNIIDNNESLYGLQKLSTEEKDKIIKEKEKQLKNMHDLVQKMKKNMNDEQILHDLPECLNRTRSPSLTSAMILNSSFGKNTNDTRSSSCSTFKGLEYSDQTSI